MILLKMSNIFKQLFIYLIVILFNSCVSDGVPEWPNHDISTLKLLQIVHRHGERTVLKDNMPKTDPFRNVTNWPDGFGELTTKGKLRMYRVGTYLRQWYDSYLGQEHSPREVYTRSSLEHRCIESASGLLSGLYRPEGRWKWDDNNDPALGQIWQPFPIETFMPKDEDTVLVPHKKCPKASEEHNLISDSAVVKQIITDLQNTSIYSYIKELFGESIDYLYRGQQFWDTLKIELELGMRWPNLTKYTQEQIIKALEPLGLGSYIHDWNRDFIRRIRLGKLVETLIGNMKTVVTGGQNSDKKVYVYSTHDSIVVPLMQTIGKSPDNYNGLTPGYGAAILIELHLVNSEYLVQVYYYNETEQAPSIFPINESFESFEQRNQKWFYTDFNKECGIQTVDKNLVLSEMTFLVIGIAIGIGLIGLNIIALNFIRARKNSFNLR